VAQQVDRGQRRQDANEGRKPDQPEVVGVGDAIIDFQHEIGPHWRGDTAMHADLRGKYVSWVKPRDFQGISMAEMPAPHGNAVAVVTAM
jgi:hypothetical protein